jgi:hypothetical protein
MNIQTISIVVPTKGCVNKCKFCVSRMHDNPYEDTPFDSFQIKKRIKWAVMNNVNTCILTGTGEALQNKKFLKNIADLLFEMNHPFPNIELQTSGVFLLSQDYDYISLLQMLGVNTVSISVSDIFDDKNNMDIIGTPERLKFKLSELTSFLKSKGMNIRLSLNMTSAFEHSEDSHLSPLSLPIQILSQCKKLGADQITFRKLFESGDESDQSVWVRKNKCSNKTVDYISEYIKCTGTSLYQLPFGSMVYSIMNMSTVIDDNCMNKDSFQSLKYVILREDGKLYSQWDDNGSLIF